MRSLLTSVLVVSLSSQALSDKVKIDEFIDSLSSMGVCGVALLPWGEGDFGAPLAPEEQKYADFAIRHFSQIQTKFIGMIVTEENLKDIFQNLIEKFLKENVHVSQTLSELSKLDESYLYNRLEDLEKYIGEPLRQKFMEDFRYHAETIEECVMLNGMGDELKLW